MTPTPNHNNDKEELERNSTAFGLCCLSLIAGDGDDWIYSKWRSKLRKKVDKNMEQWNQEQPNDSDTK